MYQKLLAIILAWEKGDFEKWIDYKSPPKPEPSWIEQYLNFFTGPVAHFFGHIAGIALYLVILFTPFLFYIAMKKYGKVNEQIIKDRKHERLRKLYREDK